MPAGHRFEQTTVCLLLGGASRRRPKGVDGWVEAGHLRFVLLAGARGRLSPTAWGARGHRWGHTEHLGAVTVSEDNANFGIVPGIHEWRGAKRPEVRSEVEAQVAEARRRRRRIIDIDVETV